MAKAKKQYFLFIIGKDTVYLTLEESKKALDYIAAEMDDYIIGLKAVEFDLDLVDRVDQERKKSKLYKLFML